MLMRCFQMARIFRMGPIQSSTKDVIYISENENEREQNLTRINNHFQKKKDQNCQLVVCIMDSNWHELRPTIKLNGTVHYGNSSERSISLQLFLLFDA